MANAIWTGTISFGLVTLPIKLYSATKPRDVRFHEFDRLTGRRVRHRRVVEEGPPDFREPEPIPEIHAERAAAFRPAPAAETPPPSSAPGQSPERTTPSERDVAYADVVRGYDVEPGRHVLLTPEELEELRPERSKTLAVEEFVDLADVDPVYFDKSYYVVPQSGQHAERPYALLLTAMERAGRVAVGRLVLRTKEHLVAIRPAQGVLMLHTLFFGDEVVESSSLPWYGRQQDPSERELTMAEQLIGMLAVDWDPARYRDEYRERALELIASKAPEAEPTASEEPAALRPGVAELMSALEESVRALKKNRSSSRRARGAG